MYTFSGKGILRVASPSWEPLILLAIGGVFNSSEAWRFTRFCSLSAGNDCDSTLPICVIELRQIKYLSDRIIKFRCWIFGC